MCGAAFAVLTLKRRVNNMQREPRRVRAVNTSARGPAGECVTCQERTPKKCQTFFPCLFFRITALDSGLTCVRWPNMVLQPGKAWLPVNKVFGSAEDEPGFYIGMHKERKKKRKLLQGFSLMLVENLHSCPDCRRPGEFCGLVLG